MKFQRRILPPHSPVYLEMEEYTTPASSRQSISFSGSTSDLSEIGSVYSLPVMSKQRSDSLTNLFNMSEDSTSLSNLSIASYSLSQHSCENGSYTNSTNYTAVSPITLSSPLPPPPPPLLPLQQQSISNNHGSDKISRKQYSSSYRSLSEEQNSPVHNRRLNLNNNNNNNNNNNSRRSGDSTRYYHFSSTNMIGNSLTTSSQKSFSIKTAETVLNTIGITTSSSHDDLTDKCGLIAHDGNDTENNDEDTTTTTTNNNNNNQNQHQYDEIQNYGDTHFVDNSDENELDMTLSRNTQSTIQTGRGLRKTVLSNVDRLLNSGNKQIKL
ncbi:unnamed protein product [Rotaria socialis]|uniref:Uncharacterized protein n=1 Tax=Rotaria socialis TaxID=392032 RepID=A0A817T445_9BILA|nr:unnamed protein product [Rotaria socialis]CAF3326228.1 unnamed protein product [Rotaria socialis]CAF4257109.1 unnamed protein product [Rotaria socialis]CAF4473415.1 unnamed protein product [Rotaria socialis]